MSDLNCSEYSEKAIVVRGDSTKTYKEDLKTLGGKYNASLKGGAGWIFSKTSAGKVDKFISSVNKGDVQPTLERASRPYKPHSQAQSQPQPQFRSVGVEDYASLLQDIRDKMIGKDPEYKLSFLSSVTLILSEKSKPVSNIEQVTAIESSEEEEEAPPRRRLLR